MSEEFNFDFNEINLDFLLPSPPKESKPQYDNISVPKQECILESITEPTKRKKIKYAQKRVELAKKINEADTLLTQINKLEEEKLQLAQQLVDFQRTANEIKKMYTEEKQQCESVLTALYKSQKKCDTVESEMANTQFKYEQMQAQWDEEKKRPIDYDDLALKFIKVVQKFEDSLYKPDIAIVEDIKRYCLSRKLKMPSACATSPKQVKTKNSRIKKQEQSIQCELWREEERIVKDKNCLVDQATQCQVEMQEQGTQHISTMTTRGTTTREFIKQHHVSTCFPEPAPIPSVEAILKEISQWNVMRISPIRDLTPEMDTKIYKTVGTCTWLCNVRRKIDFMPNKVSRPPSRQWCQSIKQEIKTPAPSPTPKQTSIRSGVQQSVVAQRTLPQHHHHTHETVNETTLNALNTPVFEELWQVFGKMVRGLLQHNNAAVCAYSNNFNEINQQQFHDWLRQLYESTFISQNGQNANRSEVRTALTAESSIQTQTEQDVEQETEVLPNFKKTLQEHGEHIVRPQARHFVQTQMNAEVPTELQPCISPKAKEETEEILKLTKENINIKPAKKSVPLKISKMKKKKIKKLRPKILNRFLPKSQLNAVDFLANLTTFPSNCNALGEKSILKNNVPPAETTQQVKKEKLMLDLFGDSDDEICKKGIHERSDKKSMLTQEIHTKMELRHNANASLSPNLRTDINTPFSISPILKSNKEENDKKTKEYQNSMTTASSISSICDIELCESKKFRPPNKSQDIYYASNSNKESKVCLEKNTNISDKTPEQHNAHNNASSLPSMANNLGLLIEKVEEKNRESNLCQEPYVKVTRSQDLSEAGRSESCAKKINEYEKLSNKNTAAFNRFSTSKNDLKLVVKEEPEKPTTKCVNPSQDNCLIVTVNSSNSEIKNYTKNTENATERRNQSHVLTKDTFNISSSCENLSDEKEKCKNENISSVITVSDSHKCMEICETATERINEQKWQNFFLEEDLELSAEEEDENMTENANSINSEKPSSHTSTQDENELIIDECFTEATNENSDSRSSSEYKSYINESMNSTKLSNLFNNSAFEEILTDSIRPIVSEMLTEYQRVSTPIPTTTTTSPVKTRKRLNDNLLEDQAQSTPCKRSARLSAKRELLKNHSEVIGKYTKGTTKTYNYELRSMSKLNKCKNLEKVSDMKEIPKEEQEEAVPVTLGFFIEQCPPSEQLGNDTKDPEQDNVSTHEPQGCPSNKINRGLKKINHELKSRNTNETLHSPANDNSHLFSKLEQKETPQSADSLTIDKVLSTSISSVLNVAFCESPQSPPPYQSSESEPTQPKLIPLENFTANDHFEKHDNNFLFDQLIASYDENIYKKLYPVQNSKEKSSADDLKERILSHLREFCYTDAFPNGNVMASQLVKEIQHITTDYEQVYSAVIATAQNAPASEVRERELPSVIQEIPPRHLSRVLQRLHYVLKLFFYVQPDFCSTLMSHIEQLLFNLRQSGGATLTHCLNLTQLYLLACEVQKNQLEQNPARLFIANCLYFYNAKAILMIHEVLMWHPTVLPPREERTYDRSDVIITVIQHLLMNTKYDMDKAELRGRTLLSKLRYEYHFEPFRPTRADVIVNLMDKLKANKLQHITYAFALLCKRMPPEKTTTVVLNEHLIPLAQQYYQFAQQSDAYDTRIVALLHIIAMVVKPFPLETDITKYLTLFARFLNAIDRPLIKENALSSILILKRFGYVNCYNLICRYKPTHAIESTTRAMFKSFIYRKPIKFWKKYTFSK